MRSRGDDSGSLDERDGSRGRKRGVFGNSHEGLDEVEQSVRELRDRDLRRRLSRVDRVRRRKREHADEERHREGVRQQRRRNRPDRVVSRVGGIDSQDLVTGSATGNGAEAWIKLVKLWDSVVACRNRALLTRNHHSEAMQARAPERDDREVGIQRAKLRETERRGRRATQTTLGDLKMTAFECMLPHELENQVVLNRKRLNTFSAQEEEIKAIIDAWIGANI